MNTTEKESNPMPINSFTHDIDNNPLDDKLKEFMWQRFLENVEHFSFRATSSEIVSGFKGRYKNFRVLESDTRRVYIRVNDRLIKVQRVADYPLENSAEDNMWTHSRGTPYRKVLNPVEYVSVNRRILVMPFLIPLAVSTPEYKAFEKEMNATLDLYLTYPQGTSMDMDRIIHYPYTREYPKGILSQIISAYAQ